MKSSEQQMKTSVFKGIIGYFKRDFSPFLLSLPLFLFFKKKPCIQSLCGFMCMAWHILREDELHFIGSYCSKYGTSGCGWPSHKLRYYGMYRKQLKHGLYITWTRIYWLNHNCCFCPMFWAIKPWFTNHLAVFTQFTQPKPHSILVIRIQKFKQK